MWSITKSFEFDYGHRVWTQNLKKDFSCDTELKCRFLHGHRGVIKITLSRDHLESGMVTDFKHLNWFKKFIDEVLDHKTIIDIHDPALNILFPVIKNLGLVGKLEGYSICPNLEDPLLNEIYGGIVIVDFIPTSENLSAWLYSIVYRKMKQLVPGVEVEVTFFETPSSCSHYRSKL